MKIDDILDLVPIELFEDFFFQNIREIIVNDFDEKNAKLVSDVIVSEDIYDGLSNKDGFQNINNGTIIHFMYSYNDFVCSLGIKKHNETINIYFQRKTFDTSMLVIYIKRFSEILIETKEVWKEKGFYKDYKLSVYPYDGNYTLQKENADPLLDTLFGEEFGIPVEMARLMRKNFRVFSEKLSYLAVEQKMRLRDANLSDYDFLYFRSPWLVSDVEDFIIEEYNSECKKMIQRVLNTSDFKNQTIEIDRIKHFITWIKNTLNNESEFVISDNIFQNISPILSGEDAPAYDTRGIIIEKNALGYFLYKVSFKTRNITFTKESITKEMAQELFLANPKNLDVEGLSAFLGIKRGR